MYWDSRFEIYNIAWFQAATGADATGADATNLFHYPAQVKIHHLSISRSQSSFFTPIPNQQSTSLASFVVPIPEMFANLASFVAPSAYPTFLAIDAYSY